MYRPINHGYIEAVIGPMYSGKSEELIRRLKRAKIAKQKVLVFKPKIDDRYSKEDVVSHSGESIDAFPIQTAKEIYDYIDDNVQVVGIDEVQFFENEVTAKYGRTTNTISYEQITDIIVLNHTIILNVKKVTGIPISPKHFTKGSVEELYRFLQVKCPGVKLPGWKW